MNQTTAILIDLLKKTLWGTELPDYGTLYSEPVDWDAVFSEAKNQSVASLAFPALFTDDLAFNTVPSLQSTPVPKELLDTWESYSDKLRVKYHHVLSAQDALLKLLKNNNIKSVILKGAAAAVYYPAPSRRSMGDIDFLVPQDQYEEAEQLLKDNGYNVTHPREDNSRHCGFIKDGIEFEIHHHFSHDDAVDIEEYLINGLNNIDTKTIDGHSFPMLPATQNGLVLLDHMRNHLQSGMGLRQVIDWMMYVNATSKEDFWEKELLPIIKQKNMYTFAATTTKMCKKYLGLTDTKNIEWCDTADPTLCEELFNALMSNGNFGRKKGNDNNVERIFTSIRRHGLFHRLQESGKHNWKAYKKHPWLKPFCWIYQIFRYARQGLSTGRNTKQIKQDLDESKQTTNLLKKLGI